MDFDSSCVGNRLTSFDSETLDSDLDMFISFLVLDTAIADKFAKTNGVKINNEDVKQVSNTNKNIQGTEYRWMMFTRTKLLNNIQETNKILPLLG